MTDIPHASVDSLSAQLFHENAPLVLKTSQRNKNRSKKTSPVLFTPNCEMSSCHSFACDKCVYCNKFVCINHKKFKTCAFGKHSKYESICRSCKNDEICNIC